MSRNLDRALEVLDVGAQGSDEPSYGYDNPDACARCQGEPPVDGDLCPGCRAFLLGDSDDDPTDRPAFTYTGRPDPPVSAFQRAVEAEMAALTERIERQMVADLHRPLWGDDGGVVATEERRPTWLNPPPIPVFTEEMFADAIIDQSVPSDRVYLLNPAYLATQPHDEVPYAVSYLTIPDRSRHAATMFAAAQDENLAELRARGWDGLYFHRRMAERRPPGATSTRWTVMTRGLRLGR